MPFSKLSNVAQIFAVYQYLKGWLETHPEETEMDFNEVYDILLEMRDDRYNKRGIHIGD